jgi:hypothetical protein
MIAAWQEVAEVPKEVAEVAEDFVPALLERFLDLMLGPVRVPEMLYIVAPMVFTLFLMKLYFSRYSREELGWNSAVANALVLIFVGVDMLKTTYPETAPPEMMTSVWFNLRHISIETGAAVSTLITASVFGFGFVLLILAFFHLLGKRLLFILTGPLTVNLIAYLGVVIVYTHNTGRSPIPIDRYTFFAALMLLVVLVLFFALVRMLVGKPRRRR